MLEQRGSERRTARQDYVDAILCLDAANAADDVRSNPLERTPVEGLPFVGDDILRRRVQPVGDWTLRCLSLILQDCDTAQTSRRMKRCHPDRWKPESRRRARYVRRS